MSYTESPLKYKTSKRNGANPHDFGLDNVFLDTTWKTQARKENTDKLHFNKIKNFGASENTIKKVKKQQRLGENIWKTCMIKYLYPETNLTITQIKTGRIWTEFFSKKIDIQVANKHMKRWTLVIWKMQIKSKRQIIMSTDEDVKKSETLLGIAFVKEKWCSCFGK